MDRNFHQRVIDQFISLDNRLYLGELFKQEFPGFYKEINQSGLDAKIYNFSKLRAREIIQFDPYTKRMINGGNTLWDEVQRLNREFFIQQKEFLNRMDRNSMKRKEPLSGNKSYSEAMLFSQLHPPGMEGFNDTPLWADHHNQYKREIKGKSTPRNKTYMEQASNAFLNHAKQSFEGLRRPKPGTTFDEMYSGKMKPQKHSITLRDHITDKDVFGRRAENDTGSASAIIKTRTRGEKNPPSTTRFMREEFFPLKHIEGKRYVETDIQETFGLNALPERGFQVRRTLMEAAFRPTEDFMKPAQGPISY